MAKSVDENQEPKVVLEPKETSVVETPKKIEENEPPVKKLQLTEEELQSRINAAIETENTKREEEVARKKAEEEGNFKLLLENAQKETLKANQALWVQQSLNKYKLPESMGALLSGETKEVVMATAKKLREGIDSEVEEKLKLSGETVPPDPKKTVQIRRVVNDDEKVRNDLRAKLGIGEVTPVIH